MSICGGHSCDIVFSCYDVAVTTKIGKRVCVGHRNAHQSNPIGDHHGSQRSFFGNPRREADTDLCLGNIAQAQVGICLPSGITEERPLATVMVANGITLMSISMANADPLTDLGSNSHVIATENDIARVPATDGHGSSRINRSFIRKSL